VYAVKRSATQFLPDLKGITRRSRATSMALVGFEGRNQDLLHHLIVLPVDCRQQSEDAHLVAVAVI